MPIRVSCPYCNTAVSLEAAPPDDRAVCPRCGDAFPLRAAADPDDDVAGPPAAPPRPAFALAAPPPARRRSPLRLAAAALALTLVGVAAGVLYSRKSGPPAVPTAPDGDRAPPATPPGELAGLRYLRPDANVVFAVRPVPFLLYATRTSQDPQALLAGAGVPSSVLSTLADLGVPLAQIDHVAGCLTVGDGVVELRATVVLVLRGPLADEEAFRRGLQAQRTTAGGRTVYRVKLGGVTGVLAVKAAPAVWAFGYGEQDLPPAEGGTGPTSPTLREMLATRLAPETAMYAVADEARWAEKPSARLALEASQRTPWLDALAEGRAAAAGLTLEDPPRLRLFVRAADDAGGEALRSYFQRRAAPVGTRRGGAGEWATFDAPVGPKDLPALVGSLAHDAAEK